MLKSISMRCFRKHENRKIVFTDGLSVLRGANEAGKSTVAEATLYAFFGAKYLRDSFDNVVTWGCKPGELKVVVEFGDYEISRAKSGAEVRSMGQVLVTGQTEVTKFCENLLGCDAATATALMFANQNAIRGVLEAGPKAAAQIMETVSDFDLFDRLLDAAQHKLSLGSCAIQEERLASLRAQIEALVLPEKPDEAATNARLNALAAKEEKALERILQGINPRLADLDVVYQAEQARLSERNAADEEIAAITARIEETGKQIASVQIPETGVMDTTPIERNIEHADQWGTLSAAYHRFQNIGVAQASVVRTLHDEEEASALQAVQAADSGMAQLKQAYAVAEAKLVTSSVCGFCDQDVSQFPDVERKNTALRTEMAELETQYNDLEAAKATAQTVIEKCRARNREDAALRTAIRGIEQYVTVDDTSIPLRVLWNGQIPAEAGLCVTTLKAQLTAAKAHNEAVLRAEGRVETLREQMARLEAQKAAATEKRASIKCMDDSEFDAIVVEMSRLRSEHMDLCDEVTRLRQESEALIEARDTALEEYARAMQNREALQARIAETEAEVETITFNNQLLKKIRTARPAIGDRLWTMVLSAVSGIFSTMRGENSVVTRGEGGFLVNGKAASSLSGSTLDLLGIAIRIALVKTFLPNCPFLVLDEASAGMDNDRHGMMLAYIAASGFRQVIMVTHSDLPEALADNLVQL